MSRGISYPPTPFCTCLTWTLLESLRHPERPHPPPTTLTPSWLEVPRALVLLPSLAGAWFTPPDHAGTVVQGMRLVTVLTDQSVTPFTGIPSQWLPLMELHRVVGGAAGHTPGPTFIFDGLASLAHVQGLLACPSLTPHTQPGTSQARGSALMA